jgi:hypothetical protein
MLSSLYRDIHGFDFPGRAPPDGSRSTLPRGGFGLAAIASFLSRTARRREVSGGFGGSLILRS